MTTTQPIIVLPDTAAGDEIDHFTCPRSDDTIAFCGTEVADAEWFEGEPLNPCVVCVDIQYNAPDFCPFGGPCECPVEILL